MPNNNCYIALLRGINVSGQKKILMKDLTVLFESLGFTEVRTYIQSGNVVFSSKNSDGLEESIHHKIKEVYGWEVPVLVITPAQLKACLDNCPWEEERQLKSYYGLLLSTPNPEQIKKLASYAFEGEFYKIIKNCVYLFYEVGAGKAKISTNFLERVLKVSCTSRNHRTMTKLLTLASEI
ncbi:MAG: DUF1697 domain-containing protein [Gilvibacter sp.]